MYINVRYRREFAETIRLNLYLCRKYAWLGAAVGVYWIIAGPWLLPAAAAICYGLGAWFIIMTPLRVWVQVYRYREVLLEEAEFTLTSEGIERRTEDRTLRVAWDMVKWADELKNEWLFTTKKQTHLIFLRKRELSQEQQAELAAFIEARHLNKPVGKDTTFERVTSPELEEASYALAYGVARSDLKPEVQAEYDRLVAERDPA